MIRTKQLELAHDMIKRGCKLIPLNSDSKIPIQKNWPGCGSNDYDRIVSWSKEFPNCNFGVLAGKGLIILDVDNKNGKLGNDKLKDFGDIPKTFTVKTPNGGFHYYFAYTKAVSNRNFNNGLEIKSSGAQVVMPGSIINGSRYEVIVDADFAELPETILAALHRIEPNLEYLTEHPRSDDDCYTVSLDNLGFILRGIDPDLPYDDWLHVLYASLNVFGNTPRVHEALDSWSAKGQKYDREVFWKKISTFDPAHLQKLGLPRLRELQWRYPKKAVSPNGNDFGVALEPKILKRCIDLLVRYGNSPSEGHIEALKTMCHTMAHGIDSTDKFRIAFPLETGMGKTTLVVALAAELSSYDKGLLICAERIDQLEELRRSMISAGVEETKIGLYHKTPGIDVSSIKLEEMHRYQFLLVSHTRVRNDSKDFNAERLLNYKGGKRSLTIWDESLVTTESYYCPLIDMQCAISEWLNRYRGAKRENRLKPELLRSYGSFYECLVGIEKLLGECADDQVIPMSEAVVNLDSRDLIGTIVKDDTYQQCLRNLILFNQCGEVRLVKAKDGTVMMQFAQLVDECFDKMVIMDASSRIRRLISFDQTIDVYPLGVNKGYPDLKILHADVKSSKGAFQEVNSSGF